MKEKKNKSLTNKKEAKSRIIQEHFNMMNEFLPVVNWQLDKNGIFILSEGKALLEIGLKPGLVIGISVFDLYKDYPEVLAHIKKGLAGKSGHFKEFVANRFFEVNYKPLFDEEGNVEALLGVSYNFSDLTEKEFQIQQLLIETRSQNEELASGNEELTSINEELNNTLEKLNSSEKSLHGVFDAAQMGIAMIDKNGNFLHYNNQLAKMLGYSFNDLKSVNNTDITPPDFIAITQENVDKLLANQEDKVYFEKRLLRKDKSEFWASLSLSTVKNNAGDIDFIAGIINDISDRKKQEKELLESYYLNTTIIENVNEGILVLDNDYRYMVWNKAMERITGIKKEFVLGKNCFTHFPHLKETGMDVFINRAFTGETVLSPVIESFIAETKKHGWAQSAYVPLYSFNSEIIGVIGTITDVTDVYEAHERLNKELNFRKAIEKSMVSGIAIADLNGVQTYANPSFAKMLGYSLDEIIGAKPPFKYWPEEEINHISNCFKLTLEGKAPDNGFEMRFKHKGGSLIDVHFSISPFLDYKGENTGWLAVVYDISEQKKAEKIIQQSLEEKTVLLQEIHHRVKNNLHLINTLINLQIRYIKDEPTIHNLKDIQSRILSMSLVHEKLYCSEKFTRIDNANYLLELVEYLKEMYLLSSTKIKLTHKLDKVLLNLDTSIPLGLIMNELITNAMKYGLSESNEGEIIVEIKALPENLFELIIADNGEGLPPTINVYDPSSLGLRIVNLLTKQINGKLNYSFNNGSRFSVIFSELLKK